MFCRIEITSKTSGFAGDGGTLADGACAIAAAIPRLRRPAAHRAARPRFKRRRNEVMVY
jgi:hypothetical protein